MALFTAAKANLQRLALVRLIAITGQLAATIYAYGWLQAPLNYVWLFAVIGALSLATIFTFWRLGRSWPVTDPEFFAQLLLDVGSLSALLYASGGATNPFVSYYLIPLTIAATVLPWRYTLALALLCIGAYSALLFFYVPLPLFAPHEHMHHGADFMAAPMSASNPHIVGMWFNFALSAALITFVVVRMAHALREQQRELNMRRENALHNEQLLAVATLAAGTAHELGTPLNTMTLVLDELHSELDDEAQLKKDIALLKQQTQLCRATLKKLVATAETHRQQNYLEQPADLFLNELLERWQVVRPDARYRLAIPIATGAGMVPTLRTDEALRQAIINLLDNGADTQSGPLELQLQWNAQTIELRIRDHGPGIPLDIAEQLGKPLVTSKGGGLGLGLFLSHATIERCGGDIRLYNHPDGGTEAILRLPRADRGESS